MYTHTLTHTVIEHTHLPVQISPPAVHFSLALWSLFMSLCPSLQTPISPSVTFHAFLLPFLISSCVSDSLSLSTLGSESVIKYFIMALWTKWNVALPSSCTFSLSSAPVASEGLILSHLPSPAMQPRCNTRPFYYHVSLLQCHTDWHHGDFWVQISRDGLDPLKCDSLSNHR